MPDDIFKRNSANAATESYAKYFMETLNWDADITRYAIMEDLLAGELWDYSSATLEGTKKNDVLQWFGGKSSYLKFVLPRLPYGKRYVEPFGGSGVVLLNRKHSAHEVYSDTYSPVVNFYRVVQDPQKQDLLYKRMRRRLGPFLAKPHVYIGHLYVVAHYTVQSLGEKRSWDDIWSKAHAHYRRLFYPDPQTEATIRHFLETRDQDIPEDIRLAEATYWLNRLSFQGVMHRRVPNGLKKSVMLRKYEDIKQQREHIVRFYASTGLNLALANVRLINTEIRNESAMDLIREFNDPDTVLYLDPPYLHETRTHSDELSLPPHHPPKR